MVDRLPRQKLLRVCVTRVASRTLELINYARVARVRVVRVGASRTLELINYARVARVRVVRVEFDFGNRRSFLLLLKPVQN
jgi:hypothetical protein